MLAWKGSKASSATRTTFSAAKEIPWREIHRITLEVLTLRYYGIVPMGRTETLCIACNLCALACPENCRRTC